MGIMPKTKEYVRRIRNCCLIGLFLGGLWLPLMDTLFIFDTSPALLEGREPAGWPTFVSSAKELALYPVKFEQFFRDHLGFRKLLIRTYNALHVKMLQISPLPHVILGKYSWLFSSNNGYAQSRRFTTAELRQWQRVLEQRRDWLADRGSRYLFVVAPNKETVYPEFMPDHLNGVRHESLLDQLIAHLRAHSAISLLDLRSPMHDAKGLHPLYTRTDMHWNDLGMFVGYQSILRALSDWFPHLQPLPLSAFDLRLSQGPPGHFDLARLMALPEFFAEQYVALIPHQARRAQVPRLSPRENVTTLTDTTLPRAVVLHDSFAHALIPFLSEHFQRVHYYRGIQEFQYDVVHHEHPDVVIQFIVERHIVPPAFLPTNPPEVEDRYLLQHYEQASDVRLALSAQQQSTLKANVPLSVSPAKDALLLRASHTDPQLILPSFSVSPGTIPTCRIDITSPASTTLTLFYLTNNTRMYTGKLSITRKLRAGQQQVYIQLTDQEFSGALRLDPGTVTGEYRIHGIEVRAFSPEKTPVAVTVPITPDTPRGSSTRPG
jgi:hypothetical protein